MTEEEWLACDDLYPMLLYLRGEVGPGDADAHARLLDRRGDLVSGPASRVGQGRLARFARACCPRWRALPLDEASRGLIDAYERFLDGAGTWDWFADAHSRLREANAGGQPPLVGPLAFQWSLTPYGVARLTQDLAWATASHRNRGRIEELERDATDDDRFAWGFFGYEFPEFAAAAAEVLRPLPALLREVVGNPFRPVALDPAWLSRGGGAAFKLAEATDREEAFHRLPVLADALEDAGCTEAELLAHLRSAGPHVRGCWALDLLLGSANG